MTKFPYQSYTMKKVILLCILCFSVILTDAQEKTIQEKLGYPKDAKLLIVHADDIGVSHAENAATFEAMEKGSVNSASILVPCPWFPEVAAYAKAHPEADLGIHLALTSEWKHYKWGPVMPHDKVGTLKNDAGYFYDNTQDVVRNASIAEVEKELRAQIERAIAAGIDPTHFDAHMLTVMSTPELLGVYVKLGEDYNVPVMLNDDLAQGFKERKIVVADKIIVAGPADYKSGMKNFYTNSIKSLQPGLNILIMHTAYDDAEMQAITVEHIDYGAAWRQADFDFFTSEACRQLIKDQKIQLITWREVRDKLFRKP